VNELDRKLSLDQVNIRLGPVVVSAILLLCFQAIDQLLASVQLITSACFHLQSDVVRVNVTAMPTIPNPETWLQEQYSKLRTRPLQDLPNLRAPNPTSLRVSVIQCWAG